MQTGLSDLTGTSVERATKAEAQLNQSAVNAIIAATSTSGGYTPKSGDVVADGSGDLLLVSVDSNQKYSLIPVAPTRSDPNVYEYASWRSREMQLALADLTGTSVARVAKAEAQLNQSAVNALSLIHISEPTRPY